MDNTDNLRQRLKELLAKEEATTIAIKGNWGVGKTYFWKQFIEQEAPALSRKIYSYVSLFGLKDISQLKRNIFSNQISFLDNKTPWMKRVLGKVSSWIKKHIGKLPKPSMSIEGLTCDLSSIGDVASEWLENKCLKNFVICIDDLERKEDTISISEILGFINNLRENRNCHIVLLFNEEAMDKDKDKDKLKVFSEYREKVIEHEFHFELGMEKSYDLIFGKEVYFEGDSIDYDYRNLTPDNRTILAIFNSIQMTNIRIMKKVKAALDYFVGQDIRKKHPHLWQQFARDIVKCCCLYFENGKEISIEDIFDEKNIQYIFSPTLSRDDEKELTTELKNRIKHLQNIGFITDKSKREHEVIKEYLKNGFVNEKNAERILVEIESISLARELVIEHRKIWNRLWGNFQMDVTMFAKEHLEFIRENFENLSLFAIDQVSAILHDLDPENCKEIEEFLDKKINDFITNNNDENWIHGEVTRLQHETKIKVENKFKTQIIEKTIEEVIESPSQNASRYFPPEILSLKSKTVDDFYNYLTTSKNPKLLDDVKRFFDRLSHYHENSTAIDISKNLEEALHRIAQLSKINYKRVYVGIRLTPPKNVEEENALSLDNSSQ